MIPSNTTTITVTDGARLKVLPISFKNVLLSTEAEKENLGDPKNYAGAITGRREPTIPFHNHDRGEVPHLPLQITGIKGSDTYPLHRLIIRKSQKWIGTWGHNILCVTRTRRVSHGIWGRPDQDAWSRKQERKNSVHRMELQRRLKPSGSHQRPKDKKTPSYNSQATSQ